MIIGLIEMKISILTPIPTWIPWKKLSSRPRPEIYGFTSLKSQIRLAEKRKEEGEK